MKLKNKDLRKLLVMCFEKRTLEEQDILLKYFMEVSTIIILAGEVINIIKKNKKATASALRKKTYKRKSKHSHKSKNHMGKK